MTPMLIGLAYTAAANETVIDFPASVRTFSMRCVSHGWLEAPDLQR
jgi:hypothetical protein